MKLLISQDALPDNGCAASVGHTLGSLPFFLATLFTSNRGRSQDTLYLGRLAVLQAGPFVPFLPGSPKIYQQRFSLNWNMESQSLVSSIILWSSFFWNSSPNLPLHRIPHKNPDLVQYNLRCWFPVPCLHCKMPGCLTVKSLFSFGYLLFF